MNGWNFVEVINNYKKCPSCGTDYTDTKLKVSLSNEIISINCDCGFSKQVDENNNTINDIAACPTFK